MRNEVEKIIRHFGFKFPVIEDSDFYVELDNDNEAVCLSIPSKDIKLTREQWEVEQATRRFVQSLNVGVGYDLFAVLHEVGHLLSEQSDHEDYMENVDILCALYTNGTLTPDQYIDCYNTIEDEKNANDWARNWIENNKDLALYWDICMKV